MVASNNILTIRTQDELDHDYFGAQDDSDANPAAVSHAAESYESEDPPSDEDAPAARCVDLGESLVHI